MTNFQTHTRQKKRKQTQAFRPPPNRPEWNRQGTVPPTVIEYILKAGIQAPSGENLQPWDFRLDGDRLHLFLNSQADPSFFNFRQRATLISNGALVENMNVVASSFGLETQILDLATDISDERVATIRFVPGNKDPDPLGDVVWKRETNRHLYDTPPLSLETQNALSNAALDRGGRLDLVTDRTRIEAMADSVYEADRVRVNLRECHEPFYHAIRKNTREARTRGDGFTFNNLQAGLDGRIFLTLTRPWCVMNLANRLGLSNKVADVARRGIKASSAVGLLTMPGDSPQDYFLGGQALERVWLAATARGLAFQPMASVVFFSMVWRSEGENPFPPHTRPHLYRSMSIVRNLFPRVNFKQDGLISLFRVGFSAPPSEGTYRLPLSQFLRKKN